MNKTITNSIYTTVKNRTNGTVIDNAVDIEDIATLIHDEDFKPLVMELRGLDENEWSDFKKANFSGFIPSQFINEAGTKRHNGIIQIDIDQNETYTTEYIAKLKKRLSEHKKAPELVTS